MKTITERQLMVNADELKLKDSNLKVYIKENDGKWICQIFTGRKIKPTLYAKFNTFEGMERVIYTEVKKDIDNAKYKADIKASRKEKLNNFKRDLVPGVTVRTSFSYNMTFNKFYKVHSNKGNTYKFEILGTEWVDGDRGWTGNVKAGAGTGVFITGKLTATGLKINELYGSVIDPSQTFYENHLD